MFCLSCWHGSSSCSKFSLIFLAQNRKFCLLEHLPGRNIVVKVQSVVSGCGGECG